MAVDLAQYKPNKSRKKKKKKTQEVPVGWIPIAFLYSKRGTFTAPAIYGNKDAKPTGSSYPLHRNLRLS